MKTYHFHGNCEGCNEWTVTATSLDRAVELIKVHIETLWSKYPDRDHNRKYALDDLNDYLKGTHGGYTVAEIEEVF